ncbi:NitT/TauT family transport system substrate-binding protein [Thermocatellispora tengchongensis]|uniref:NitT/TauT family transport system substrate-binding protein n=1 Tax=Thermocatellispora tengchongensis TaxID=1073253 RepID=A0A840P8Y9_9ACTN|nr:ABC transporter substrate-binding protein [Thermocatellispora tengchongensis]MBB5137844.1 NitT/TauT family transport system substrate-binding protein [Thermocatellispora tengchongensis]
MTSQRLTVRPVALTRRDVLRAGAVAGLFAGVVGCGSDGAGAGGGGTTAMPAPSLNALIGNAPLHVAMAEGYFSGARQKVELADVLGTDVIRTVQTQAIVGVAGALPALVAFTKGVKDLRVIAPVYSAAQTTFIAPAGSPVSSAADLKPGMKIGAALAATPPTYFAEVLVREAGLVPGKDVQILTLGRAPDAWTAAKKGLVDVAWSNPPFDTGLIASGEAKLVATAAELVPQWLDTALVTTAAKADAGRDTIAAIRQGLAKAQALLREDRDRAAAAWARNARLDERVARKALEGVPERAWAATVGREGLDAVVAAGASMKLVAAGVDAGAMLSGDFPEATR